MKNIKQFFLFQAIFFSILLIINSCAPITIEAEDSSSGGSPAIMFFLIILIGIAIYFIIKKIKSNENNNKNGTLEPLPEEVKNELLKMSEEKQKEFNEEFDKKKKTTSKAYIYILFLFGFHYLYLDTQKEQILFTLTGGGFLIWWIIDLFRMPDLVKNCNKNIAIKLLKK